MFLQKTAVDSIAIFMPSSIEFNLPITLSTGTGVDKFINFDQPSPNVIVRPTLNQSMVSWVRQIIITGTATFHPQSLALIGLRPISQYQIYTKSPVYGTLIIVNAGTLVMDKYTNFQWTSPYPSASRNRVQEDIILQFACDPPVEVSLGAITSIATTLAGLGIIT